MKSRGLTFIEIITVVAIVVLMLSLFLVAVNTYQDTYETKGSLLVIDALLGLGRSNAEKHGYYAGIYFCDQNSTACAIEVIEKHPVDYLLPYIELARLDGSPVHGIGPRGVVEQCVVLFSKSGRLVRKDVGIYNFYGLSEWQLQVDDVNYPINSYTGQLIR